MTATLRWQRRAAYCELLAISRPIHDLLMWPRSEDQPLSVTMLARFRRALNLTVRTTDHSSVIALITPDLAIGPFHLVVDALPASPAEVAGSVRWEGEMLYIGPWALRPARDIEIWDPRPEWGTMRIGSRQRYQLHEAIRSVCDAHAAMDPRPATYARRLPEGHRRALGKAITSGNLNAVAEHATALSGCGPGLTPSGDDYLAGWMLAVWANQDPCRETLCGIICTAAQGRTTQLSLAFLNAAGRGEADLRWHTLLRALSADQDGSGRDIAQAVASIGAFGATSGVDMLVGFAEGLEGTNQTTARL